MTIVLEGNQNAIESALIVLGQMLPDHKKELNEELLACA